MAASSARSAEGLCTSSTTTQAPLRSNSVNCHGASAWSMSKVSMPARISSTGMSSAQAAATAASTFSIWNATRPPCVSGTAAMSAKASSSRPRASTMRPARR
ncbi:Uncharacterised protein [Bordetella pertussis]|nr:Uncharacterised protein [Bordetella pertussis]